ncbi:uncharacterized protein LOC114910164 isoform X2 [Scleropages formosus]|uniref:uncharacterized protein LOC114910164 isoform X2 n=1 Tax=Scleropages formosus TaxID=113540 RepID=UPI0010FAB078|nr:uncharacterized protein LOC114910164 isoform X2 [Scleropages formosus]
MDGSEMNSQLHRSFDRLPAGKYILCVDEVTDFMSENTEDTKHTQKWLCRADGIAWKSQNYNDTNIVFLSLPETSTEHASHASFASVVQKLPEISAVLVTGAAPAYLQTVIDMFGETNLKYVLVVHFCWGADHQHPFWIETYEPSDITFCSNMDALLEEFTSKIAHNDSCLVLPKESFQRDTGFQQPPAADEIAVSSGEMTSSSGEPATVTGEMNSSTGGETVSSSEEPATATGEMNSSTGGETVSSSEEPATATGEMTTSTEGETVSSSEEPATATGEMNSSTGGETVSSSEEPATATGETATSAPETTTSARGIAKKAGIASLFGGAAALVGGIGTLLGAKLAGAITTSVGGSATPAGGTTTASGGTSTSVGRTATASGGTSTSIGGTAAAPAGETAISTGEMAASGRGTVALVGRMVAMGLSGFGVGTGITVAGLVFYLRYVFEKVKELLNILTPPVLIFALAIVVLVIGMIFFLHCQAVK